MQLPNHSAVPSDMKCDRNVIERGTCYSPRARHDPGLRRACTRSLSTCHAPGQLSVISAISANILPTLESTQLARHVEEKSNKQKLY